MNVEHNEIEIQNIINPEETYLAIGVLIRILLPDDEHNIFQSIVLNNIQTIRYSPMIVPSDIGIRSLNVYFY